MTAVDPGQGYRLLKEGEEIGPGVDVWAYGEGPWEEVDPVDHGKAYSPSGFANGKMHFPMRRRLESPEAAPAEGVDLEALLPYIHHIRADRPVCEATKQSGWPCTCGLDELLRSLKGRAALSRSEAAPKAAEAEQAMIELRKRIVKRGLTNSDADEVMSDLIDLGWRPKAPESQPHTVHPQDRLDALVTSHRILAYSIFRDRVGYSHFRVRLIVDEDREVSALEPTLSEAVQAAVDKLPLGVRP